MTVLAGIDYSFGGPAISVFDTSKEFVFENVDFYALCDIKKYQGFFGGNIRVDGFLDHTCDEERFNNIGNWAGQILEHHKVERVQLEGYALGSTKGLVFQIAENTSLLKQRMWYMGIKFEIPSPGNVKKTFTGRGRFSKEEGKMPMVQEFIKRTGVDLSDIFKATKKDGKPINDICDSYALLCLHPELC